jgi:hypothetical protein
MSNNTQIEKLNCKIHIDCYGGIAVEAPTVPEVKQLLEQALSVKQNRVLQEAIR